MRVSHSGDCRPLQRFDNGRAVHFSQNPIFWIERDKDKRKESGNTSRSSRLNVSCVRQCDGLTEPLRSQNIWTRISNIREGPLKL